MLTKCRECGAQISSEALICFQCGHPLKAAAVTRRSFGFQLTIIFIAAVLSGTSAFFCAQYTTRRQFDNWVTQQKILDEKQNAQVGKEISDLRAKYELGQEYWKAQQAALGLKKRHETQKQIIATLRSGVDSLVMEQTDFHNVLDGIYEEYAAPGTVYPDAKTRDYQEHYISGNLLRELETDRREVLNTLSQAYYSFFNTNTWHACDVAWTNLENYRVYVYGKDTPEFDKIADNNETPEAKRKYLEVIRKVIDAKHESLPLNSLYDACAAMDEEAADTLSLVRQNENTSGQSKSNSVASKTSL
jgi:hypothetical protein